MTIPTNNMMIVFTLGLLLFLAVHSIRIFADGWRTQQVKRLGPTRWKALHTAASLAGIVLLIWGFRAARSESLLLWTPPKVLRHATALLTLIAFVLVAAAYVPGNRIKAKLGHPMALGTMIWALGHLLANGSVVHAMLFGGFLLWAAADFVASSRRDQAAGVRYPVLGLGRDALALGAGAIVWFVFARFGHQWLIGVSPLGW